MKYLIVAGVWILFSGTANAIVTPCNSGYYSGLFGCVACPADFPMSPPNNTDGIGSCYTGTGIKNDTLHSRYENRCYYQSTCQNVFLDCLEGYYDAGSATMNMTCTAVGVNYYSVYPSQRARCPSYSYMQNGSIVTGYGTTTGSGTGADNITDCYIPTGKNHKNTIGIFTYKSNCYYQS